MGTQGVTEHMYQVTIEAHQTQLSMIISPQRETSIRIQEKRGGYLGRVMTMVPLAPALRCSRMQIHLLD